MTDKQTLRTFSNTYMTMSQKDKEPKKIYNPPKEYNNVLKRWTKFPVNIVFIQANPGDAGYDYFASKLLDKYYLTHHQRRFEESCLKMKYKKDISSYEQNVFFDTPSIAARHYNEFSGIISIDLSDWVGLENSSAFTRLLSFVSANKERITYLFFIATDQIDKAQMLINKIAKIIPIKTVNMQMPETIHLVEFVLQSLSNIHIDYSDDFSGFLKNYINEMKQKSFVTYDTIQEIINHLISSTENNIVTPLSFTQIMIVREQSTKQKTYKIGF